MTSKAELQDQIDKLSSQLAVLSSRVKCIDYAEYHRDNQRTLRDHDQRLMRLEANLKERELPKKRSITAHLVGGPRNGRIMEVTENTAEVLVPEPWSWSGEIYSEREGRFSTSSSALKADRYRFVKRLGNYTSPRTAAIYEYVGRS